MLTLLCLIGRQACPPMRQANLLTLLNLLKNSMVQLRTMVNVADNTGPKIIQCIGVLGGYRKRYAGIGEIFNAVVKKADPHGVIKKGEIVMAVLVRSTKEIKRKDGTYVRFDDNAAVIIDKESREPKGTRIFGPVARELRDKYIKIISLAPEVL